MIEHAFDRPGAKADRIQEAADHRDPRTTMRYHQRRKRLDHSPVYDMATATADALDHQQAPGATPGSPTGS
ncbi:hypothetical protein ACFXDJ_06230 [Streptomyces sp. NPDC059443]|uniref:hypothetical protein n=1 Tax=unclassified Streptomyces TaxID=2593676 RepID=UPI003675FD75